MLKNQARSSVQAQPKNRHRTQTPIDSFSPAPPPQRLLMINNNPQFLSLMQDYLEFLGYEVITAANGSKALEFLEQVTPDVMIVDDGILHQEGDQVFVKLREKNSWHQPIPVVVLDQASTPDTPLQVQTDGYFHVPVKPEEIIALLQKVLTRSPEPVVNENSETQTSL